MTDHTPGTRAITISQVKGKSCKGRCTECLHAPVNSSDGDARSNDGGCLQIGSGSIHRDGGAPDAPPGIQELERKMVVGRE